MAYLHYPWIYYASPLGQLVKERGAAIPWIKEQAGVLVKFMELARFR